MYVFYVELLTIQVNMGNVAGLKTVMFTKNNDPFLILSIDSSIQNAYLSMWMCILVKNSPIARVILGICDFDLSKTKLNKHIFKQSTDTEKYSINLSFLFFNNQYHQSTTGTEQHSIAVRTNNIEQCRKLQSSTRTCKISIPRLNRKNVTLPYNKRSIIWEDVLQLWLNVKNNTGWPNSWDLHSQWVVEQFIIHLQQKMLWK